MEEKIFREQPLQDDAIATNVEQEESLNEDKMVGENVAENLEQGSLGKFKDAQTLLEAYNNLQAEFTRKCQKLNQLQTEVEKQSELGNNIDEKQKNDIVETYLKQLQQGNAPKVISSFVGSGITLEAPPKPTTLDEAKDIVAKLFD